MLFLGCSQPAGTETEIYMKPVLKVVPRLQLWRLYRRRHTHLSRIRYITRDRQPRGSCKVLNHGLQTSSETGI
jgi:hypothetical protein